MKAVKWHLVVWNGFEYATCCGQRYKCTTKQIHKKSENLATWVWVPEIKRYVNCVCL